MEYTTVDRFTQKLSRATLVIGMATAIVALPLTTMGVPQAASAATSMGGDATVNVMVDAIQTDIIQVNGTSFDNNDQANSTAVKTYQAKNDIHFRVDHDAHVKIVLGDKVLWEGDAKAGQPVTATIDLSDVSIGIYNLAIRAYKPGTDAYSVAFFHLDYRATIPSIIPGDVNAPNTGMYVTVGGRIYSMTTVAIILILTAVIVFLICSKYGKKEPATAKAKVKTKTNHKKMDMI